MKKKYDNRKQSIYLPGEIITKLIQIREIKRISMSRVVTDSLRLIMANLGRINWDVPGVILRRSDFWGTGR